MFIPLFNKFYFCYNNMPYHHMMYLGSCFLIFFLPFNFFAVWLLEVKGLRITLLVGMVLQTIGHWIRQGINSSSMFVMVG